MLKDLFLEISMQLEHKCKPNCKGIKSVVLCFPQHSNTSFARLVVPSI